MQLQTNESSSDRPDDWPNAPVATEQRPRKNITGVRAFLAFIVSLCALFLASYWWLLPSDSPEPPRPRIKGIFHEDYSDSFAANLFWGGKEWLLHVFSVPWGKEWLLLFFSVLAGVLLGLSISWAWIAERRRKGHSRIVRVVGEPTPSGGEQVFVSYSHRDLSSVERLVQEMERMGYSVWIDREATGAQRYATQIVGAIRTSKLVALMCSRNAFTSDHVIREIYVAGDMKKPFIAFQLDPTELPDEVLYFVSGFPRLPIGSVNIERLQIEIARLFITRPQ